MLQGVALIRLQQSDCFKRVTPLLGEADLLCIAENRYVRVVNWKSVSNRFFSELCTVPVVADLGDAEEVQNPVSCNSTNGVMEGVVVICTPDGQT